MSLATASLTCDQAFFFRRNAEVLLLSIKYRDIKGIQWFILIDSFWYSL